MNVTKILGDKGADIISIEVGSSVLEVSKILGTRRIGAIPVVSGEKLAGIISERDIMRGLAIRGADVLGDAVDTLMTKTVFTCTKEDTIYELMSIMTQRRIRHIPVMDGDALIGMVSIGDVVKERVEETAQEANALKEYIGTA